MRNCLHHYSLQNALYLPKNTYNYVPRIIHVIHTASNIIRESSTLKLTNLGAACKHTDKELVTAELQQLAYAAPELALLQRHTDNALRHSASAGGKQVQTVFINFLT